MSHTALPIPVSLSSSLTSNNNSATPPANPLHHPDHINLTRLLTRLTHHILIGDITTPRTNPQTLRQSPYHRARTLSNIEYARTLLLRLEHAAQGIKIQSQKRAVLKDLAEKRRLVKKLRTRIDELAREGDAEGISNRDEDSSSEEDYFAHLRDQKGEAFRNQAPDSEALSRTKHRQPSTTPPPPPATSSPNPRAPSPSQTLRRRRDADPQAPPADSSTSTSTSTSTTTKFPFTPSPSSAAASLSTSSSLQSQLSTSLLSMAVQLKQQSQAMSTSLAADANLLSRATDGLDKSLSGMGAAGKKMGELGRVSGRGRRDGRLGWLLGWWSQVELYVWVFGLWAVMLGLVFVGPKVRF